MPEAEREWHEIVGRGTIFNSRFLDLHLRNGQMISVDPADDVDVLVTPEQLHQLGVDAARRGRSAFEAVGSPRDYSIGIGLV